MVVDKFVSTYVDMQCHLTSPHYHYYIYESEYDIVQIVSSACELLTGEVLSRN